MYLRVRVKAGAKKEFFSEKEEGLFEISVKERAQGNQANKRVLELLSQHLGIKYSKIRTIAGHRQPSKIFFVEDKELI